MLVLLVPENSKTAAKMTVARIKLLRNKRQAVVKQMRRDIALLLQSGQDATARIRVRSASLLNFPVGNLNKKFRDVSDLPPGFQLKWEY